MILQIDNELQISPDAHSRSILVSYIKLILNFCQRFYERQFVTRKKENTDILMRFDKFLKQYFEENTQMEAGLPTVQHCADALCMSANPRNFQNSRKWG